MFSWFTKSKKNKNSCNSPIFIIGCGRSGTTLLFNIFKHHPQLTPTTGDPDGEDHVGWAKHGDCLISGLGNVATSPGVQGHHYCLYMDEQHATPDIIERMTRYYNQDVLNGDLSKRVINKCPHLSNKLRYARAIFPQAKFVHIIRDCLPVVSSWIKIMEEGQPGLVLYWPETEFPCFWVFPAPPNSNRTALFQHEDRLFPGGGTTRLVDYWSEVNRNISLQLLDTTSQLLTIKYEDLCARPMETLNHICDFCEISRFEEPPLQIQSDFNEKYKNHLTERQITDFLARADVTRRLFGYL